MADADTSTRDLILKLASDTSSVRVDGHARSNMLSWRLRLGDVCEAICNSVSAGDRVKATSVKEQPRAMVGQPAYELWVMIDNRRFYVRVTIYQSDKEILLIISVHPD